MSKENLIKLLEAAMADKQLRQQLESAPNYEEFKNLAGQHGFDLGSLSEAEAAQTFALAAGSELGDTELSEGQLDMVAGGRGTVSKGISFKLDVVNRDGGSSNNSEKYVVICDI